MRSRPTMGRLLLGSTALAAVLAIAPAAVAQEAEGTAAADGETVVVVTGIRNSLQTAAQVKRRASTFVDSITASDVSTLPDLSVAEALSRVPGVTVTRYTIGGSPDFPSPEGRGNLIRGLGFVRSEFNGRDTFTANGGRELDWSSIPPELVGAVDVFKNSSADLIEGGIGGTINLRTLEPFDRRGFTAVFSADATYGDLREKWSPSYSLMLGNRWQTANGEFGLLGSFSTSSLASDINGWQQGAPFARSDVVGDRTLTRDEKIQAAVDAGYGGSSDDEVAARNAYIDDLYENRRPLVGTVPSFQMRTNEVDRDRTSYYLAGQWRNDTTRVTLKYIRVETSIQGLERTFESFPDYNSGLNSSLGFSDDQPDNPRVITDMTIDTSRKLTVPLCSGAAGPTPITCDNMVTLDGGLMTSGWVSSINGNGVYGAGIGSLGIGKHENTTTEDFSANIKWRPADRWFVEFDAQMTKSTASTEEVWGGAETFMNFFVRPDLDNPYVEFEIDPRLNPTRPRDPDSYQVPTTPADPNAAYWLYAGSGYQDGTGDLYALRADAQYDFSGDGWFKAVKFGARYSQREQLNKEAGVNWSGIAPDWAGQGGFGFFSGFQDKAYEYVDFSDFQRGGVVGGEHTSFVFVDRELLLDDDKMVAFIRGEPTLGTNTPWVTWKEQAANAGRDDLYEPGRISDITEKTTNFYIRFDFGKEFANGMSLDGNFGVRHTKTDFLSTGAMAYQAFDNDEDTPSELIDILDEDGNVVRQVQSRTPDAESRDHPVDFLPETAAYVGTANANRAATPRTVEVSDEHWLPSFNLKWNLNDEMLIRFGASKNMSRPRVQDLRAAQVTRAVTDRVPFDPITDINDPLFGVDRGAAEINLEEIRVSGGNPILKPTTGVSYDVSYEWYFPGGTVSAAVFKKDLENIIMTGDQYLGDITLDGQTVRQIYNGPVNVEEASVQGFEVAYQQFYDFLPGWMSHLGLQTNYTWIDASAPPPPPAGDANGDGIPDVFDDVFRFNVTDLLGQSEHIFNIVGIYQDDRWEARLAYNWRSEYLTTYRDYITGSPIYIEDSGLLDASLKYTVNDRLQLRMSVANVLDAKSKASTQLNADGDQYGRFSFLNDRRIVVGFRYQN